MTSSFKSLSISDSTSIAIPSGPTIQRPAIYTSIIQWTNTGSQSYSVLAGATPTLTNTSWTAPTGVTRVEVLVVAGGGAGGNAQVNTGTPGGGGGAGGVIYQSNYAVTPGSSYTVTVGAGGITNIITNPGRGANGSNSVFDTLTAVGGGGGGGAYSPYNDGASGGSGGGGCGGAGGAATAGQGFPGGSFRVRAAGGGGAGGPGGQDGNDASNQYMGCGGVGLAFSISGTATWYAGGGGAGASTSNTTLPGVGGQGGGGLGAYYNDANGGTAGTASTGSGGGGGAARSGSTSAGGAGGSGIVIIKYSVVSDNTPSIGLTRFNTESRQVEVYQGTYLGWVGQDTTRNFAGHNLFSYSSTFTNASWLANNSTAASNATIAPDGTGSVFTAIPSTGNTTHQLYHQTGVTVTAVPYTFSIYVKANGYTQVRLADVSNGNGVWFNVSAGTIGSATSGFTGTIVPISNSWYRCSITFTPSAGSQNYGIYIGNTTETTSYTGDGTSGVFVWGAQLEQSSSAGPYVKTAGVASPIPTVLSGYRIHTYTTTGTSGFTAANTGTVEVLVVGAGGAGRTFGGGGGGGGGVIYQTSYPVVSGQSYTVFVGTGGSPGAANANGENSQFASLIAIGGGASGADNYTNGRQGGAGGGAGTYGSTPFYGGPGINNQGYGGGHNLVDINYGAGGGGAGGPGRDAYSAGGGAGPGGPGVACSISGTLTFYGGGGGGAPRNSGTQSTGAPGGIGGGGAGSTSTASSPGVSGTANTGGGGGGGVGYPSSGTGGSGGSGIVIVRYRYD